MSMWADYKKEREDKQVIEEADNGFVIYSYPTPEQVWIEDIYVRPDLRQSGLARKLADQVCEAAKKVGCKQVLGSVWETANGATASVKVLLAYGMQLSHIEGKLIIFKKEL